MTLTVNHSTSADGSFSATGATAWNAAHTLTGTIDVINGGTGQTTTTAAINALLPTQATNSGKYLTTDGTNTSWATVSGGGSPGGSTTQFQYNNAGAFAGSANLVYDGTNVQVNNQAGLRFSNVTTNYVAFKAPATIASNVTWTLPATDGTSGQVLSTNGSGVLSWVSAAPTAPTSVEYLVVAGGGGGGGGGGGAGGLLTSSLAVASGAPLTVTVGAGGAGGATGNLVGVSGSNSVFSSITATGGGGGGAGYATSGFNGLSGGSGGGGGTNSATSGTPGTAGTGTSGQGNSGGIAFQGGFTFGGGGGAGAAGISAPSATATGTGGAGLSSSITGSAVFYAGGGGPANSSSNPIAPGLGGTGGGGAGQQVGSAYPTGQSGTANTGGGGGAGFGAAGVTGSGGSGVVIIRYPDTYTAASATTGSPTVTITGGYRIYKWTGSGSITF